MTTTRAQTGSRQRTGRCSSRTAARLGSEACEASERPHGHVRTPAHVRVIGVELDDDEQALIRRKLGMKLGKFATSIERVSVRVTDTNGPRGGVDQVCNVKVVLSGLPSVVIERRDAALHAAIDVALRATEQAVRRSVRRRRMKPLRGRHSATEGISPW